jgi:GNAT superfamily N-acetyltransferase
MASWNTRAWDRSSTLRAMVSEELMPRAPAEHLRLLSADDIAAAFEMSAMAGWNQTQEDWRMLLELAPAGCFAMQLDGQVAATTTMVCYGQQLAWIGMVLTQPRYRRRGLARRLLGHALDQADALGIETVKLDATEQGQPLYEEFGFRREQPVQRWFRPGSSDTGISAARSQPFETVHSLDFEAFGVNRWPMVRRLAQRSAGCSTPTSYLLTRPGRQSQYLGPCVCGDPHSARTMMMDCLQTAATAGWSWDLLPENRDSVTVATELGFCVQRHLLRMVRGRDLRGREAMIYAIAGFELG